jgi:hypothetical protein
MQANHIQGDRPLKKKSTVAKNGDRVSKPSKARDPVQRDAKEVMAELVAKLSEKLDPRPARMSEGTGQPQATLGPNRDRLTVGVDLGDKWSNFCILGLDGEKLSEGELQTARRLYGILPALGCGASGDGSGDPLSVGAGRGGQLRP